GRVAASTNLRDERATRRRFVEIELVGEAAPFLQAMDALGFEHAPGLHGRLKLVLPPTATPRELFAAAQRTGGVIRRLTQRRDTLEDVFLRAMGQHPAEAAHGRP